MRDGNHVNEEITLKRTILRKLYENPDIISLLDCADVDPEEPDTALYKCIFPYVRIPETQETVGCFIGVKVEMVAPYDTNDRFMTTQVRFVILCSFDLLKVSGQKGIRTECLAAEIENMFNGNKEFGFTMRMASISEDMATHDYYGCIIDFDTIRPGTLKASKPWPR